MQLKPGRQKAQRAAGVRQPVSAAGGFDPNLFRRLAVAEERSFWFRARNELIVWAVRAHLSPDSHFLEVGCGTGFVLSAVRRECGLQVTGGELFPQALEYARRRLPEADFVELDSRLMPYDQAFDGVGVFDVLEHIDDDLAALKGLRRAVRTGGYVFITVPQHPWLWSAFDDYSRHVRRYRRAELVERVRQAGLVPVRVTSFVTSLLPMMAASRLRRRTYRPDYDPIEDLVLPAPIDRLFERALRAELQLIRRGVTLPAGGSLLVVARRD